MKALYVMVLPDNTEYFFEHDAKTSVGFCAQNHLQMLVRTRGLTAPRSSPRTLTAALYAIKADGQGTLQRSQRSPVTVHIPFAPLTDEEFAKEQDKLLASIPREFASLLSQQAYDRGHSCGHEEVLSILQGLVADFKPAIEAYTCRAVKQHE